MKILNDEYADLQEVAKNYKEAYNTNPPFPNISFNDFLNPEFLDLVLSEFPDLDKKKDKIYYKNP